MPKSYEKHTANVRQAAILLDDIKTAAGCVECGFNAWPEALHFDHIDPQTKLNSLGWVRDRSKLTTKARLDRYLDHIATHCVVRCANCHARRTKQEKHYTVRRGETIEAPNHGMDGLF